MSSESGGPSGARRGRGHRSGGGQGRGRGRGGSSSGAGVTATAPEIPVIVQVETKGAAAEAAAAVAAASTCLLTAVFAEDRRAIGEKTAQRRRANSYPGTPGAPGAQVLATKRVPAHRTRRYWWWSCRYPKKTSPWKLRRSR